MQTSMTDELKQMKIIKEELTRFMMYYKFALAEIETKIDILKQEFQYVHEYSPIEHVTSRVKSPESIVRKVDKKQLDFSLVNIRENIRDIAGVRITCSFVSDIYEISRMLLSQKDIKVVDYKDYIKQPKPNGYRSLHLIIQIPIFMSDRVENVYVEIQIRTIAMDFWASLEHKLYYKHNKAIPAHIKEELKEAADSAAALDDKMEHIRLEMNEIKGQVGADENLGEMWLSNERFSLPTDFLKLGRQAGRPLKGGSVKHAEDHLL